jgi:hypothetical protein
LGQAADQLTLLDSAHALDFLGNVLDIRLGQFAGAQKPRLFIGPGVKIVIIKGCTHDPPPSTSSRDREYSVSMLRRSDRS